MSHYEFEEEEFTTEFNGKTIWRILKQALPVLCITLLLTSVLITG